MHKFACVAGFNLNKTAEYVFFYFSAYAKLWMNDLSWLRISCVKSNNFFGHAVQFIDLISQRKNLNEYFHTIWLACILSI